MLCEPGAISDEDDLYALIGCNENSTEEQINTEYKILALKFHPDKNPGSDTAVLQFQKLQEAVNILLDPVKRQDYDKWRHSQISIPYKQWTSMNSRFQMSMHWAKPREQVMLENVQNSSAKTLEEAEIKGDVTNEKNEQLKKHSGWQSEDAAVYKGFRNYAL